MKEPQDLGQQLAYCGHLGHLYSVNLLRRNGYDVTPVQTRALICLACRGEPLNQRNLEHELRLRPSTVNGIVNRLEEKGYILRRASPADGRCRLVSLTDAGQEKIEAFRASLEETNRRICANLTPEEQTHLSDMLSRIIADLENEVNKE
ncbi:MAG: MarR family transcriptional regulator [Oscillospiraceae bacterium]|nr:MarR family transcriptional regulator [Oscillospiraceae bacterium]